MSMKDERVEKDDIIISDGYYIHKSDRVVRGG